jgi:hypothetical protein
MLPGAVPRKGPGKKQSLRFTPVTPKNPLQSLKGAALQSWPAESDDIGSAVASHVLGYIDVKSYRMSKTGWHQLGICDLRM